MLLELFSTLDDTFTEDDALSPEKRQMTVGRVYRAWKDARLAMDPEFDSRLFREQRRRARGR